MSPLQEELGKHLTVLAVPHDSLVVCEVVDDDKHAIQAPLASILLGLNDLLVSVDDPLHRTYIEVLEERRLLLQVDALLLQIFLDGPPGRRIRHRCRAEDVDSLERASVMVDANVLQRDALARTTRTNAAPSQRRCWQMLEATPGGIPIDALGGIDGCWVRLGFLP